MSEHDPDDGAVTGTGSGLPVGASLYLEHVMAGHRWRVEGSAHAEAGPAARPD